MKSSTLSTVVLSLAFWLGLSALLHAEMLKIPQTGQTKTYAAGDDGALRTGMPWPLPRFQVIYCRNGGQCSDQALDCDADASTDAILDRLTGLMWARSGNLAAGGRTWSEAVSFSRNLALCGFTDWRLANVNELESLVNVSAQDIAAYLEAQAFTDMQSDYYWSSTTVAMLLQWAWKVHMSAGMAFFSAKAGETLPVLPVRGATALPAKIQQTGQNQTLAAGDDGDVKAGTGWPSTRFSVIYCNSQGRCQAQDMDCDGNAATDMVRDNLTGLTWARSANLSKGPAAWTAGLGFTNALSLCGVSRWRLPDRKELHSLTDYSASAPALPPAHPFASLEVHGGYWTSTTWSVNDQYAWLVGMSTGDISACPKKDAHNVWPVMTGCLLAFAEQFALEIDCLELGGQKWGFTFQYTGEGLKWEIAPASIMQASATQMACLVVENDLSIQIPCADFFGTPVGFLFQYTGNGLVWEISPASIHLVH